MALAPGSTLGPYAIRSQLGSGGMGVVYTAHDPRLDRQVAIKVLPPDLTRDETAKQRFLQEAKAASALDHPNICTIYEINETADGQLYLVMAYYEGETLKQRIERGPLALDAAIDIATQVGQGLSEAHGAGIVHRDIKPANLLIAKGGVVKILDFGLAKLAGSEGVTQTGTTVGTVAYMSPEQARGEEVDHRTDIWSLGVVLYEMLRGRPPFRGENLLAISGAIQQDPPPALTGESSSVSGVVGRALNKNESQRYQAVTDLLDELRNTSQPETPATRRADVPSIAVLPFTNMSPDPEQEYFSDGLTEEIIADLSKIRALRVISRTSIMRLKGTEKDLRTIGQELNVRYLLEGSVRKSGDKLRITAQLIDARDDAHLWAEKYGGSLEDVFDIQERVSREIVKALEITLTPDDDSRVAERPIQDVRAFECYLRAKHEIFSFTQEGLDRALDLLREGIEIVGENALLYATLGMAYWQHVNAGVGPDERYLRQAEECATKVFQLEADSAPGHYLRGMIWTHRGHIQEAVEELGKALAVEPDNSEALLWRVVLLGFAGRDSTVEAARLQEVDPLTPMSQIARAWGSFMRGQFAAAIGECRRAYDTDQDNPLVAVVLGDTLARDGRLDEATATYDRLALSQQETMFGHLARFLRHALNREKAEALQTVTATLTEAARWDLQYSWDMATGYALIDERDQAYEWLEHATRRGFINYPFLAKYDPLLENIRQDERFATLMADVRSQWERFEV